MLVPLSTFGQVIHLPRNDIYTISIKNIYNKPAKPMRDNGVSRLFRLSEETMPLSI